MNTKTESSSKKAADGERRAVRGYSNQYAVAATIIYDGLIEDEIEWIRVADPEAGRLDDLVVARPGQLDAYQVKWDEYDNRVTFNNLISESKIGKAVYPSPISILADGWKRLIERYPDRLVRVHYLTRNSASSSDDTGGRPLSGPRHLQAFLRHVFAHRGDWTKPSFAECRSEWQKPIEAMESATGLEEAQIERFLVACEFDFGFRLDSYVASASARRRANDITALAQVIQQAVASEQRTVQLNKAELLKRLDWTGRFEFVFRHDFPVDERLYRPVQSTVLQLENAFNTIHGGYLALVGPPGSGKSTTLTQMLRYRESFRIVRYYAFVRGDVRQGRGEAEAFLHDLCLALEVQGVGRSLPRQAHTVDCDELRERLGELFGALNQEWETSGTRTLILIDGLDHIEREQSPTRSLIEELPHPAAVPEGVLVVLGSQQIGLDSNVRTMRPIRAQLEDQGRTIQMARLERSDVYSIVFETLRSDHLSEGDAERIYTLSGGHPLALSYLIKRVSTLEDASAVQSLLSKTDPYANDIEHEYRTYWDSLMSDAEVRELLGLVCRLRSGLELEILEQLSSPGVLERFVANTSHYFHHETPSRWTFFHNSFRQYLLTVTGRDVFNQQSLERERGLHQRLAKVSAAVRKTSPFAWERIYHLEKANETNTILAVFSQDYFREQFLALRSLFDIRDDLDLCVAAAVEREDWVAVIRAILVDQELSERTEALSEADVPSLLLELAHPEDVADRLLDGLSLRVSPLVALGFADGLLDRGDEALARRAFNAAEPLDLLSGVEALEIDGRSELLDEWVRVAWRFRPLEVLFSALSGLRVDGINSSVAPTVNESDRDIAFGAQVRLLVELGIELVDRNEMDLLTSVKGEISRLCGDRSDDELFSIDIAIVRSAIRGNWPTTVGRTVLEQVIAKTTDPAPKDAIWLADMVLGLTDDREEARRLVSFAPEPLRASSFDRGDDDSLGPVAALLVQARVLSSLGRPMDPVAAIPTSENDRDLGVTLFQRMIVLIGTAWGDAAAGKSITSDEIVRRLRPAFTFFQRPFDETNDWREWYLIQRRAPAYYKAILRAAHSHGQAAMNAVLAALFEDFQRQGTRQRPGWRLQWKREILLTAYHLDGNDGRTSSGLDELERELDIDYELHDRISDHRQHLLARLNLDQYEQAEALLVRMLKTSFGVHHQDDDQLTRWSRWAAKFTEEANEADGKVALLELLRALPVQNRNSRGDDILEETEILVAAATTMEPAWGYSVARWLRYGGKAERSHVLSGLVSGCLNEDDPESVALAGIVTARLIVPFETVAAAVFPKTIGRVLRASTCAPVADAYEILRRCADVKALPGTRRAWAEEVELVPAPQPSESEAEENSMATRKVPGLLLSDGTIVSPRELESTATEPEQLSERVLGATSASGIDLQKILSIALPRITDGTALRLLRDRVQKLGLSVHGDALFADRAARIGQHELAAEIQTAMLAESRRQGWIRQYDGGTRLAYAQSLVATEGAGGRREAAKLFASDYIEGLSARDLLFGLNPILEVIFEQAPIIELWNEFSQHAGQLAEVSESDETPPSQADPPEMDAKGVLVDLLFSDLESPVVTVATEARKGLLDLIHLDLCIEMIEEQLCARLNADDAKQTIAASVILCAVEERPEWTKLFLAELAGIAWSPSAVVRLLAQQILRQLQVPIPSGPPEGKLPPIFALHLPEAQMRERATRGDNPDRGEPLPDTIDPIDLASLFSSALDLISDSAGLSYEALANRLATLMRQLQPPDEWSQKAERNLQRHLEAIDLKAAFRRPRSLVSFRAFSHLVAELVDARALPWPFDEMDKWLLQVDPRLGLQDPSPVPRWLKLPEAKSLAAYPSDEWVEASEEALGLLARAGFDGGLVLAEYTLVEGLGRERPREVRASMAGHPQFPIRTDRELDLTWFYFRRSFFPAEYPNLYGLKNLPVPVLAGGPYFADADFLAVNPILATHLGWRLAKDGLFRWVDSSGATMVESIWWQNGNRTLLGAYGYEEATAEGWLVVATRAASQLLREPLRGYRRYLCASRETAARRNSALSKVVNSEEDL